jgi:hypothetical protein
MRGKLVMVDTNVLLSATNNPEDFAAIPDITVLAPEKI